MEPTTPREMPNAIRGGLRAAMGSRQRSGNGSGDLRSSQLPHPLPLQLSAHEPPDRVQRVDILEKHGVDGGDDGHFDAVFGAEVDDGAGGGDAFDDGGLLVEVGVEFLAFAEGFAAGAVAAFGGE